MVRHAISSSLNQHMFPAVKMPLLILSLVSLFRNSRHWLQKRIWISPQYLHSWNKYSPKLSPPHLLHLALNTVASTTLQLYWMACSSFKLFHNHDVLIFLKVDVLTISSFVSYTQLVLKLKASTIKAYLAGIHFFNKLIFGTNCKTFTSPYISLLLKCIPQIVGSL